MATVPTTAADLGAPVVSGISTIAGGPLSTTPGGGGGPGSPMGPAAGGTGGEPSQPPLSSAQTPQSTPQQRSVKRPRPVKSCTECRKRKLRCDRLLPCSQCQKSHRSCKYSAEHDGALSDGSDIELPDAPRPPKRNCLPSVSASAPSTSVPVGVPPPTASSAETLPVLLARSGETLGLPAFEELVSRLDRLEKHVLARSPAGTDRSMARSQSRVSVSASPKTIRGLTIKKGALQTRFFGQNSSRVMLNLFEDAKDFINSHSRMPGVQDLFISLQLLHRSLQEEYRKSLNPITLYVDSIVSIYKRMADILPKKPVCDRLLASYIDTSESLYRMIHVPTFQEQYDRFWAGKTQADSFLPRLLAVLSIGSRFDGKNKGLGHERMESVHIPTACVLVRSWLDGLKGKQLVELTTLQAEVLLLQAQRMVVPRFQDSWMQLGSIVRMAMTMGLHRDPSEFEPRMDVFSAEMRRRFWFTILDMDLHTSLACNLPCLVRDGDYTCRTPRNLDDVDLYPDMTELPLSKPIDQYTDNQIQVYAAITLGARMRVAHLINRIDSIRDYAEVLEVGAKLERFLEDINYLFPRHGIQNDPRSKQWRSRVILDMHVRRPLLALYRPFALGVPDVPTQITRSYLRSSMVILKYLDELDPMLSYFQDITDMYHQILKQDIIQAAFSVCFYLKTAARGGPSTLETGNPYAALARDLSPAESLDETYSIGDAENITLWSPARLTKTVEKTLDLLIRNVRNDVKDIVALTVVLHSVQNIPHEQRVDDIVRGLRATLESCMRATNTSAEKMAELARTDPYALQAKQQQHHQHQQQIRQAYLYPGPGVPPASHAEAVSRSEGWSLWSGWEDGDD